MWLDKLHWLSCLVTPCHGSGCSSPACYLVWDFWLIKWHRDGYSPSRLRLKCDGRRAETRFVFRRNGRVHLNRRGRQFSRLLTAEVCASAVVMVDTPCSEVVWRVLATHSIRQVPFTSPPVRHRVPSHFNWTLQHSWTSPTLLGKWPCNTFHSNFC